jgi:hypothetical protein
MSICFEVQSKSGTLNLRLESPPIGVAMVTLFGNFDHEQIDLITDHNSDQIDLDRFMIMITKIGS